MVGVFRMLRVGVMISDKYILAELFLYVLFGLLGSMNQNQRLDAMAKLKQFHCRVLISTDLVNFLFSLGD